MADISLTAGMRNNLLSLQGTNTLINKTQNRLATGKKVNSALDNPTNFFASQGHNSRASDLAVRKDGMLEAVQSVKAADYGISAISSLIESAKGVAQAALSSSSNVDRSNYASTYNNLLVQITELASDSGYRGTNFLTNDDLTVEFSDKSGASTLQIQGFDATTAGMGLTSLEVPDFTVTAPQQFAGATGPGKSVGILSSILSASRIADINSNLTNYRFVYSGGVAIVNGEPGGGTLYGTTLTGSISAGQAMTLEHYPNGVNQTTGEPLGFTWSNTTNIQSSSLQLDGALSSLRTESSKLSANLSVVTTRQEFTDAMINTLQVGADNLTLADMNEEGANMLMLQTRQNLGITSLSMASQAAQAVMRLF